MVLHGTNALENNLQKKKKNHDKNNITHLFTTNFKSYSQGKKMLLKQLLNHNIRILLSQIGKYKWGDFYSHHS